MQEDDNTSKEPRNLELENRPLYFKFLVGGRRDDEVRADEHYAAAKRAMFYLSALLWLMQQLSPSHLELENNGDVAAQINYASELGDLLEGLAHQHLEMLERERE
ncbi:MAG TPA: hypothetical protein VE732_01475, partial [Nitrososphaera sp.]|nr:hypothetical protein [Nitrososphaera sp.]